MQQPPSMLPAMPSFPPTSITTDQIEKCLEENKKLILAILDNQNLGKLAECAQYQAQLQKNLMYLAAIADAQPQMSMMPAQMSAPHPGMQQGAYYMHPQAAAMAQQNPGLFPPKMHMQFASPHQSQQEQHQQHLQQQQQHQQQHQHQQAMQGQMNVLGGGSGMHSEAPGQNKQDAPRSSAGGHDSGGNPSN